MLEQFKNAEILFLSIDDKEKAKNRIGIENVVM